MDENQQVIVVSDREISHITEGMGPEANVAHVRLPQISAMTAMGGMMLPPDVLAAMQSLTRQPPPPGGGKRSRVCGRDNCKPVKTQERNALCECGSGQKFKKCCLRQKGKGA